MFFDTFFLEIIMIFFEKILSNFFHNVYVSMNRLRNQNYKNENNEKKTLGTIG